MARLFVRRAQAILMSAKRLLYLHYVIMGGRHPSRDRIECGGENKAFVVHL